jgi:hypothetical protein
MVIQTLPNEDKRRRLRQESANLKDHKYFDFCSPDPFLRDPFLRCAGGEAAMRDDFDGLGGYGGPNEQEKRGGLHAGESKQGKHS